MNILKEMAKKHNTSGLAFNLSSGCLFTLFACTENLFQYKEYFLACLISEDKK